MEDYLHFLDFSSYIFKDDGTPSFWPSPAVKQMWEQLQTALQHYFRYTEGWQDDREAAHQLLLQYSDDAKEVFGARACTFNLHTLNCR